MAQVNNSEILQGIRNAAKLQLGKDITPNQLAPAVHASIEVNPQIVKPGIIAGNGFVNQTSVTVYTTPIDQDFYLTSACIAFIKDASATSLSCYFTATINGATVAFLRCPGITLTAQSGQNSMVFPHPVKIDRGTNIGVNSSTNVANISCYGAITGFLDETSKA